eukprot:365923-Chlamydomonas_euryale.AAC.2
MPYNWNRNNRIVRRQARPMGLAGAAMQGAALAYRNRGALWEAGQKLARYTGKRRWTEPTRMGMQATTVYAGGNDISVMKSTYSRTRRPRTNAQKINMNKVMIKSLMQPAIFRAQGIMQYDPNVGFYQLRQSVTAAGAIYSPVLVWDLTSIPNRGNDEAAGYSYGWEYSLSTTNMFKEDLATQDSTGSIAGGSLWYNERNGIASSPLNVENGYQEWTAININFYGPRKRTSWFEVIFFTPRDDFADPFRASLSNSENKYWLQYLERPLIYSNLQTDVSGKGYNKMRIIRRYKYFVSASQTTDVDTSVGKIKQAEPEPKSGWAMVAFKTVRSVKILRLGPQNELRSSEKVCKCARFLLRRK